MKNKINDLNQQLNRLRAAEDHSHSSTSSGEGDSKKRPGSPSLHSHHSYLKTLEKEFLEQAKEQVRIRDIIAEKSASA